MNTRQDQLVATEGPWPATGQWVELCLPPMTESRQRPGSELSPQHTEPGQGGVSKKFSPAGPGSRGCRPGLCSPQGASRSLRTQKLGREVPSSVAGPKPLQAKARFNLESPWMERGKNTACLGFPGGANGKKPACQCRRHERSMGWIPGSGRSPGGGHGN